MNKSRRDNRAFFVSFVSASAIALGLGVLGCTAATPDSPAGTGGTGVTGGSNGSGSGGSTVGSGGSPGSGGSVGPGSGGAGDSGGSSGTGGGAPIGSGGSSSAGSGGSVNSGGSSGTATGGSGPAGGANGTGGRAGTGGGGGSGTTTKGCWNTPTGNYAANATLTQEGKIVLFDGTNLLEWKKENTAADPAHWTIDPNDKSMVVEATLMGSTTDLQSRKAFEDLCVHVEYMTPVVTSANVGQNRGNSGVYLKSAYELQILDSVGFPVNTQSCGAVYLIRAPYQSSCFRQEIWNTYEMEFKSSKWTGSTKVASPGGDAAFVSVTLNGMLVQGGDDARAVRMNPANLMTEAGTPDRAGPQPLMLQDHRWRVRFRNIWVRVPQY